MSYVCRPRCCLEAAGARLRLPLPNGVHREQRRGVFFSLLNRRRWRTGPGCTGQGFLSSQSVIFFGLSLLQAVMPPSPKRRR